MWLVSLIIRDGGIHEIDGNLFHSDGSATSSLSNAKDNIRLVKHHGFMNRLGGSSEYGRDNKFNKFHIRGWCLNLFQRFLRRIDSFPSERVKCGQQNFHGSKTSCNSSWDV